MEDELIRLKNSVIATLMEVSSAGELERYYIEILGKKGQFHELIKGIKNIVPEERSRIGIRINEIKKTIESQFNAKRESFGQTQTEFLDTSIPGLLPPEGHLHIVTQAIMEITRIFERIGFSRVRHPEIDWDWYAFESLNMPPDHPARDEWETFHIKYPCLAGRQEKSNIKNQKFNSIVLTPQTSNGQVREMEKGYLPIRMINIAKCYRRQSDISHTPMFHQFEGLYVDKNVSIVHLKGVFDYFVKEFFGRNRIIRLRPFHFQFTEPSFEIDIDCDICHGKGCRLCKEGWLEMAGAGMVHPNVLKAGSIDPLIYSGFAFGWGVERAYMMKSGVNIDDLRLMYGNDVRFLEQF